MKTIVYLILLFLQVVRHNNVEQLLLHGRMLQASEATTKFPCRFSCHSATTGSFFTLMLLGLKLCSCQFQGNLHKASLGWFCHQPEWFGTNNGNFSHSEAQSVHSFVQFLLNHQMDVPQNDSIKTTRSRNGNSLLNMT
uniref:PI4-kinase N-terminal domain-containing protein n=1 Tax=Lactuca sativa TaxID=4236 RepID=A0A9R1X6H2_LACSA|nr:hypothetical protein LSAT_V11C600326010 [Lactuca sativa]